MQDIIPIPHTNLISPGRYFEELYITSDCNGYQFSWLQSTTSCSTLLKMLSALEAKHLKVHPTKRSLHQKALLWVGPWKNTIKHYKQRVHTTIFLSYFSWMLLLNVFYIQPVFTHYFHFCISKLSFLFVCLLNS